MTFGFLATLLIGLAADDPSRVGAPTPPNVVFILADDLGWADVGSWAARRSRRRTSTGWPPPARGSTQFYVQPVCSPTRAALMTGRYPMRHGLQVGVVRPWAQYGLPLDGADARRRPSRRPATRRPSAASGTSATSSPTTCPPAAGSTTSTATTTAPSTTSRTSATAASTGTATTRSAATRATRTHLIAREAVAARRRARPASGRSSSTCRSTPSTRRTRSPTSTPGHTPELAGRADGPTRACSRRWTRRSARSSRPSRRRACGRTRSSSSPATTAARRPDASPSNGPLRAGKATLYEGGVRVAAFATWDGQIPAGSTVTAPLHIVDWYPTLLKLAGASLEQTLPLDGRDAWPPSTAGQAVAARRDPPEHHAQHRGRSASATGSSSSLTASEDPDEPAAANRPASRSVELFNLRDDPYEKTNLADREPRKVQELQQVLDRVRQAGRAARRRSPSPRGLSPRRCGARRTEPSRRRFLACAGFLCLWLSSGRPRPCGPTNRNGGRTSSSS